MVELVRVFYTEIMVAALGAIAQIAAGLWLISFAVIGGARERRWELLRLPAPPVGLGVIFLL